jgi:mannose-6-phosphate isomerase-like protein (cupin superfamily)
MIDIESKKQQENIIYNEVIVERNFQKMLYPINDLPFCSFPCVKLKHDFNIILSWEEIIFNVNKQMLNNSCIKHIENNTSTINYQVKKIDIKKLYPIKNLFEKIFPNCYQDTDLYGSYETSTGGFKIHKDIESTILHLQQGEVIIMVTLGSINYIFDMKKNDMLYIKKGIYHSVIGLTPRFLTSYGIYN